MKKLNLQIDKKTLKAILDGKLTVEHRNVYPNNAERYVIEEDTEDENGEEITIVTPVHYDAILFINGRKKDAPKVLVEIKSSEFVIITDEDGNDLTYEENGEEYFVSQVWYTLGKIISTENIN